MDKVRRAGAIATACVAAGALAGGVASAQVPTQATVTVDTAAEGTPVSPLLYGVFFEDINFAADGGLYAELVRNRSFEYYPFRPMGLARGEKPLDYHGLTAWSDLERAGAEVRSRVAIDRPINERNPNYAMLLLRGEGGQAGLANEGVDGITVEAGKDYTASLFARWEEGEPAPLRVALETADGNVLAEAELYAPGEAWEQQSTVLTPERDASDARFVVTTTGTGRLALDVVSLMPQDTFKGRKNGLRNDLAEAIAAIEPKTFRFPGGCIVHGNGLDEAYRWKDTIGPLETRRPNSNRWGYHQTYGLGYYEYFQFAEDIGAEPLPILPVGVSCGFEPPYEVARGEELDEWIQDVLDLVEFANGPVDSEWGKVRAKMGHPEPFNLKYIGLGNEEHDTALFRENYPKFVKALREAHPEITIVGTSGLSPRIPAYDFMASLDVPITDEHYYERPEWFIEHQDRFDDFDRSGPKVYVGEYASRGNTLFNAIAEAVYLTGIERNADHVVMTAYAPLLARYGHTQWQDANLIWFDDEQVVLTSNYHVQKLFSTNVGDRYLPAKVSVDGDASLAVSMTVDEEAYYLKIVNPTDTAIQATIKLENAASLEGAAERTLLSGERDAENTRESPDAVAPVTEQISIGETFELEAPATSVQVIRIPRKAGNAASFK